MSIVQRHILKQAGQGKHNKDVHAARSLAGPFDDGGENIDIRGILQILWRRRNTILLTTAAGLAMCGAAIKFVSPTYSAASQILIETESNNSLGDIAALIGRSGQSTNLLNEVEIIQSRQFLRNIVQNTGYSENGFQKTVTDKTSSQPRGNQNTLAQKFMGFNLGSTTQQTAPNATALRQDLFRTDRAISEFEKHMRVRIIPGSSVLSIQFSAPSAHLAASTANAIAKTYLETRQHNESLNARRALDWLDDRLLLLRSDMQDKIAALQDFRNAQLQNNQSVDMDLNNQKISELQQSLSAAEARELALNAKIETLEKLAQKPEKLAEAQDVATSGFMQQLRSTLYEIQSQHKSLSERYGPKHPHMQRLAQEENTLKRQIRSHALKTMSAIKSELSIAANETSALQQKLDNIIASIGENSGTAIEALALQREADIAQNVYAAFLENAEKLRLQNQMQNGNARILSYAALPEYPVFPNIPLWLSLSMIASLFIGVALAFLQEKTDNTLRSAGQIENYFGLPCLGLIPKADIKKHETIADYVLSKPSSTVSESMRTLRTVLKLKGSPKVIMITSSFPGEGKTTLSCWLARMGAKSGENVLLIDGDMRRSNVEKTMGTRAKTTLVDYLSGQNPLDDIIHHDPKTNLNIIYAGSAPNSALDLIGSDKFKTLMDHARNQYDLVIIDSPACLAVSDARLLSTHADHTLYTVAWDSTPREIVAGGLKQFTDLNIENLSFVLSNVDIKRHIRYGYGDSIYYDAYEQKAA